MLVYLFACGAVIDGKRRPINVSKSVKRNSKQVIFNCIVFVLFCLSNNSRLNRYSGKGGQFDGCFYVKFTSGINDDANGTK